MKSQLLTDPFPTVSKSDTLKPPELMPSRPAEVPTDARRAREGGIDEFFDGVVAKLHAQAVEDGVSREGDSEDRRQSWRRVVCEAEKLRRRLSLEPRLCYFDFSSDHEEISVRIAGRSPHPDTYFILSRHEPDTRELPPMECVWLRQIGEQDALFDKPLEGLRELAVRLARLLV